MSQQRKIPVVVSLAIVFGFGWLKPASAFQTTGFQQTLVSSGLNSPTAMEFAPDGRLFVAEQAGHLRVIKNGALLQSDFVTLTVASNSERGLLGIAFDPNFSNNRFLYLYYTRATSPIKNRISRFTASATNPDVVEPGSEVVILDNIASDAGNHNGGAIHFGLDGKLYAGVGDGGATSSNSQSLGTLSGKLLRINSNGTVPSDNPFVSTAGARGEIWALGLRNPYTFAVDPMTGKIHVNDVGAGSWEEVNLIAKGANYGWPTCEGLSCGSNPNFTSPIYTYSHAVGQAITGGAFYRQNQFPSQYFGSYFFSDYLGGFIKRLDVNNQVSDFWNPQNGPVDLKVGPDGALYYLSIFNGAVYKILSTASNQSPTASFTATPASGLAPLTVSFNGSASSDPNGDPLTYSWNFGDGSAAGSGVSVSHTYQTIGSYTATLTVSDGRGGTGTASKTITVTTPVIPAIALDAATHSSNGNNVASISWSHTVTSNGSNVILIVGAVSRDPTDAEKVVTGVTFNGVNLTRARQDNGMVNNVYSSLWYLVNPARGSHAITVSYSGAVREALGMAASFTGVDQSSPINAHAGFTQLFGTTAGGSITTTADKSWLVDVQYTTADSSVTPTSGQTIITNEAFPFVRTNNRAVMSVKGPISPAGNSNMSYSYSESSQVALSIVALKPAGS